MEHYADRACAGGHRSARLRPRWLALLVNAFMRPARVVMQHKQLLNLKLRAEGCGRIVRERSDDVEVPGAGQGAVGDESGT